MKLHEFLSGTRKCPDDRLTEEFGIDDNFYLLLDKSIEFIIGDFEMTKDWTAKNGNMFIHTPGSILIRIQPAILEVNPSNPVAIPHQEFQLRSYKTLCSLHYIFYGRDREPNPILDKRSLVNALNSTIPYIFSNQLGLCLPKSIGSNYKHLPDKENRIVYYPDDVDRRFSE